MIFSAVSPPVVNALSLADEKDLALAAGNVTGALFCIPVMLKDNYDTADMRTTGGCLDLQNSQPTIDAPSVAALKRAGAIVLGKTNLHELALEGLSVSSLGGQTVNPYDVTRTPGGSSGGTGAAVAASPASANSLFSIRPTRGLLSRAGIIPISYTQDAIGPIARNVRDVAVALEVMASVGYDKDDNTTALIPAIYPSAGYVAALESAVSLKGVRLGLVEGFFNQIKSNGTSPVNDVLSAMVSSLRAAGATIVQIDSPIFNSTAILNEYDTQRFEYKQEMDQYLQGPSLQGSHPSTLNELYDSKDYLVIPSQYSYVNIALVSSTRNSTYATRKLGIENLTLALQTTFKDHNLDALIYSEQANLVVELGSASQSGRNGILAAVTRSPVVTVPAGLSAPTADAPKGIPIGMEMLGMPWSEAQLLKLAKLVSEVRNVRRMPASTEGFVESKALEVVPSIIPNAANIPALYPVGTL
ncbi:MAG: hypothetical protein Q9203_006926 [Teloschistes exilis]